MPSLRWKIFIILAFILFFFFGVVIGSQHYKPQKLNSFIKLFDLRNGKMLQVYDAYQGGRPSRTILYDKNNKNNYIDIWYNYDGSIDYFMDAKSNPISLYPSVYNAPTSGFNIQLII